jgi:hypothetical protein
VQKNGTSNLGQPTTLHTMSNFCPIMLYLPTLLKSDVINGRFLKSHQAKISTM